MSFSMDISTIMTLIGNIKQEARKRNVDEKEMVDIAKMHCQKNFPEEYEKFLNLIGCKKSISDYGFTEYLVVTDCGGEIKITDYQNKDRLGMFSISNGGGMASFREINSARDIGDRIEAIERVVWLNNDEKIFLVNALNTLR
ncbi:hypothetical protein JR311_19765 (plasmid) [Bacillus velezensis]|uniref:hypothetical protein n=1 Tax=Bacillus velezensis TaxID=492670 RepID=UPI00195D035F|nr:hypothetical protein [Bacillus velezensis]QRV11420.1 hypothetical protein JR311_20580 [Bacillus velezensis]QRV11448.1 hypothetical protein JR311_19765 [Bacillus velezensis]